MAKTIGPLLSIVLPAYNASGIIAETVGELQTFLKAYSIDGEIIVVDDGSTDGTFSAIPKAPNVRIYSLDRNRGKGAAIREGLRHVTGQVVILTDADLPYGTSPIPSAIHLIRDLDYHAVMGDRSLKNSSFPVTGSPLRRGLSALCTLFVRMVVAGGVSDTQCGFKAFRVDVANALAKMLRVNRFAVDVEIFYILLKHRLDIKRIPVSFRINETSTVRVVKDSLQAAWDILTFKWRWMAGEYRSATLSDLFRKSHEQLQKRALEAIRTKPPQ